MALKLEAKLTDIEGNPLGGKEIIFYYSLDGVNFNEITRQNTDPNGIATTTYQPQYYGTIWFKAVFPGDPVYESSEAVVKYELGYAQMITNILSSIMQLIMMLLPIIILITITIVMFTSLREE